MNQLNNKHRYFPICNSDEITDLESRELVVYQQGRPYFGFVVKKNEEFYAYANSCPHQGRMLQWKPDTFLTKDLSKIMCAAHGANFEIESGLCIAGPCLGQRLKALDCCVIQGVLFLSFKASAQELN